MKWAFDNLSATAHAAYPLCVLSESPVKNIAHKTANRKNLQLVLPEPAHKKPRAVIDNPGFALRKSVGGLLFQKAFRHIQQTTSATTGQ